MYRKKEKVEITIPIIHKMDYSIFFWLWLFILFTSALDALLLIILQTFYEEKNPFGFWLINNYGRVGCVIVKMTGTVLVMETLWVFWHKWREAGQLAVVAIALFQLGLMVYLFTP